MRRKKRLKKLNLIKPDDVDPQIWQMLTVARAGREGHQTVVQLLLDCGADVDAVQKGGSTDWYRARGERPVDVAFGGNELMLGFLLARRAEYTLDLAAVAGDEDAVKRLSRSKTSRDTRGGRALATAASEGKQNLVKILLRAGVDPTTPVPNVPKGLALWHASNKGHLEIAKMLIEAGAYSNAWIESSGAPVHQSKDDAMKALMYCYGGAPKKQLISFWTTISMLWPY